MSLLLIYRIFTTSIDAIQSNWDIYLGNNHLGAANADERVFSRFTTTEDVCVPQFRCNGLFTNRQPR